MDLIWFAVWCSNQSHNMTVSMTWFTMGMGLAVYSMTWFTVGMGLAVYSMTWFTMGIGLAFVSCGYWQQAATSLPSGLCWWMKFQPMCLVQVDDRKGIQPQNLCTSYHSWNVRSCHSSSPTAVSSPVWEGHGRIMLKMLKRMYGGETGQPRFTWEDGVVVVVSHISCSKWSVCGSGKSYQLL